MTKKIFRSTIFVVTVVLILSFTVITGILYENFSEDLRIQLNDELRLAAYGVNLAGEEYLRDADSSNYRLTWISQNGMVLYDTAADINSMDDHSNREEIRNAVEYGFAESSRYSDTLTTKMLYSAIRLDDGSILRISAGTDSIFALLKNILTPMMSIALLGMVLSSFLANRMAKGIVRPLETIDLENPAVNESYEELDPILRKVHRQHIQINEQLNELREKAAEFDQIIYSMTEGLILLDKTGAIKRMNPASREIFGIDKSPAGYDFLSVDRSLSMTKAVEDALNGKHCEFREQRNGREYQFSIDSIASRGEIVGCVILCFDVSETALAEQSRREFTANVTHELKTPLQSIIGSAELLENGLVKPEDTQKFVGNIKNEATRLVSLINDIISLSQLDENSESVMEEVDIYNVAEEVFAVLHPSAEQKDIIMELHGESAVINGVRRYLYDIIYNLCDNAIRYTNADGRIDVSVTKENGHTLLSVSDTGIGIPKEHHHRIFERFYRVDKSHSKETGGTGLGLSIVKHAAAYHHANIKIDSAEGNGTTISITF